MPVSPTSTATETAARVDVLGFITSMTDALAWPIAVGLVVWVFHREIKLLLPKLASLKAVGVEASFGKEIDSLVPLPPPPADIPAVEEAAAISEDAQHSDVAAGNLEIDHAQENSSPRIWLNESPEFFEYIDLRSEQVNWKYNDQVEWLKLLPERAISLLHESRLIADDSPRSAVSLAWRAIEITTRECAKKVGLTVSQNHTPRALLELIKHNKAVEYSTAERYIELYKLRNDAQLSENFSGSTDDAIQYIDRAEELAVSITIEFHLGHPNVKF
ncbi:hypothetical protein LL972_21150 [Xanthomonas campestris pv. asclepiadis]|uniref:hypothetical protein n=1 Tax=Xanthomonas campestris TaxID=339 RepID=UPI001E28A6F7|nr:hypothetical protein [Xanthomonas campestris]MCC4618462.1 hypothetical protein [Xanthomonas campestris pv. asclepiadis]